MKKKFICLAVIAAMVFAFTACGNAPAEPADESVVEPVETRTVYVTPEWLQSALDGNQEGYELLLRLVMRIHQLMIKRISQAQFMLILLKLKMQWVMLTNHIIFFPLKP